MPRFLVLSFWCWLFHEECLWWLLWHLRQIVITFNQSEWFGEFLQSFGWISDFDSSKTWCLRWRWPDSWIRRSISRSTGWRRTDSCWKLNWTSIKRNVFWRKRDTTNWKLDCWRKKIETITTRRSLKITSLEKCNKRLRLGKLRRGCRIRLIEYCSECSLIHFLKWFTSWSRLDNNLIRTRFMDSKQR